MPSKGEKNTTAKQPAKGKGKKQDAYNPLYEKKQFNWNSGFVVGKRINLTHFVRWPHYVRVQRQRKILYSRLRVPPAINQFSRTLDKSTAVRLFKLLHKYRPPTPKDKKKLLLQAAKAKTEGKAVEAPKRVANIRFGIQDVTSAIESKRAKLVVIAHDVDPIEIVVWLPALCRRLEIPYVIVKSKSRLGLLVHRKFTSAIAITNVNKEDANEFAQIVSTATESFNNNADMRKLWGGGILSKRSQSRLKKREAAVAKEKNAKIRAEK